MKINTKIRYGLRMMVVLGEHKSLLNTEILGQKMLVSPKYLRKLAGPLEKAGLLESIQGKLGGYKLRKEPEDISIANVFKAYNEELNISGCTKESGCLLGKTCITSGLWDHFENIINRQFFNITIKNIIENNFNQN